MKRSNTVRLTLTGTVAPRLSDEDCQTVHYLRDTCAQAGHATSELALENVGWDARQLRFVDLDRQPMNRVFKLHPWEWMWGEPFARHLAKTPMVWIEPAWKMLLSNKGLLPIVCSAPVPRTHCITNG